MKNSFYEDGGELFNLGFKHVGKNVKISRKISLYNIENVTIGNNVRIDDFVIISGGGEPFNIGNNVHIAAYSSLIGKGRIDILDFANISSRVSIYSSSDDYSGTFMTNPTVDEEFLNIDNSPVIIGKHCIIGAGCIVLPGVNTGNSTAFGAFSLLKGYYDSLKIYEGIPAKYINNRGENHQYLEKKYLEKHG